MFREVHIVAALARTTGATNTCRPLTNNEAFEGPLVMADPLITGCELTRNCALATNYTQNQEDVKPDQAEELGPLHILLSQPPQPKAKSRGDFLKSPAKRLVMFARCHGLLSVKATQKIIDKFDLRSA